MGSTIETKGFDDADKRLAKLPIELRQKALIAAVRKAGRVVIREARTIVPVSEDLRKGRTKHLRDALAVKVKEARVGVYAVVGATWEHGRHSWLVEGRSDKTPGGFEVKNISRDGEPSGTPIPRQPFLDPAASYTLEEQNKVLQQAIEATVKRVMG